ncbi:hypothetical protein ACSFBI_05135 [Variovorax sp. RB3P1]|uniref:hypothetical protein n=1 Tax=Variovorax sp. RB3P1 TaxID=3443732 RepID=UPI003F451027
MIVWAEVVASDVYQYKLACEKKFWKNFDFRYNEPFTSKEEERIHRLRKLSIYKRMCKSELTKEFWLKKYGSDAYDEMLDKELKQIEREHKRLSKR